MATHYIALIHKDPDTGYGVSFPDVPGVIAVADTLDTALAEAAEALGLRSRIGRDSCRSRAVSKLCAAIASSGSGLGMPL